MQQEFEEYCREKLILPNPFFGILPNPLFEIPETQKFKPKYQRKYACDHCGKIFKYLRSLKTHQVVHSNVPKIRCEWCPLVFNDRWSFNTHMKNHTCYQCSRCCRQFIWKSKYKKHKCE